jgi:hypothetical protein
VCRDQLEKLKSPSRNATTLPDNARINAATGRANQRANSSAGIANASTAVAAPSHAESRRNVTHEPSAAAAISVAASAAASLPSIETMRIG